MDEDNPQEFLPPEIVKVLQQQSDYLSPLFNRFQFCSKGDWYSDLTNSREL